MGGPGGTIREPRTVPHPEETAIRRLTGSVLGRYAAAIALTSGFMVWQARDGVAASEAFADHAAFWIVAVAAGWLQMIVIARGVRASLGPGRYPGWVLILTSALLGAMPLTFEVRWLMQSLVDPEGGLPPPWVTYLNVAFINLNFCLIQFWAIERWPVLGTEPVRLSESLGPSSGAPVMPTVGLLRRRPEGLGGRILYLQMEDHYLRVRTDEGEGLVLHRMRDAVQDLAAADGLQVHRSWWVARSAVDRIVRAGRSRSVRTTDGREVPIGRSFEKALRAAEWI